MDIRNVQLPIDCAEWRYRAYTKWVGKGPQKRFVLLDTATGRKETICGINRLYMEVRTRREYGHTTIWGEA
jgi:hypothetical protein